MLKKYRKVMTKQYKLGEEITKQLDEQGISYKFLSVSDLESIVLRWKEKFIGKRNAPNIEYYKWHIFSFNIDKIIEGERASIEYGKQYPCDIYIFNENLQYGLLCSKSDKIPEILMEDFCDDIYICHHNMKWTYVMPHEFPGMGPYFSKD
jgi:hypothetical protein